MGMGDALAVGRKGVESEKTSAAPANTKNEITMLGGGGTRL